MRKLISSPTVICDQCSFSGMNRSPVCWLMRSVQLLGMVQELRQCLLEHKPTQFSNLVNPGSSFVKFQSRHKPGTAGRLLCSRASLPRASLGSWAPCRAQASAPGRSRAPAARASEEEDVRGERGEDDGEDEDELGAKQDLLEVVEESPQRRATEEGEVGLLAERGGGRRRRLTLLGCSRRGRGGERNM